jgi:predicted transposase YdaD
MTTTDSLLKQLVSQFIDDFAVWLLNTEIRDAYPLSVELPGETTLADQVFQVTLADGRTLVLHIEFQGRRSHRPMQWRMLEYIARLAEMHHLGVCSVVFYVGRGAGANDTGQHQIICAEGGTTVSWHYRVIRLWEMKAEELLGLGRPALLALIGQTQIDHPDEFLPQVVERLKTIPDPEQQGRLLTALAALISDEEMITMIEKLVERDELFDSPFLRRIRQEGWQEGKMEGRAEGQAEGREEGRAGLRRALLNALIVRFDLSALVYQQLERQLHTISDESQLEALLTAAIRCDSVAGFQEQLAQIAAHQETA